MYKNVLGKHDIYISYRRDGGFNTAVKLNEALKKKGYDSFVDSDLLDGPWNGFDAQLSYIIENCKDFILILPKNGLDRCIVPNDWVRLEIERAKEIGPLALLCLVFGCLFVRC